MTRSKKRKNLNVIDHTGLTRARLQSQRQQVVTATQLQEGMTTQQIKQVHQRRNTSQRRLNCSKCIHQVRKARTIQVVAKASKMLTTQVAEKEEANKNLETSETGLTTARRISRESQEVMVGLSIHLIGKTLLKTNLSLNWENFSKETFGLIPSSETELMSHSTELQLM